MKKNFLYIISFIFVLSFAGCSDDEDNKPSMSDTDRMEQLLDKNNSKAVDFKNKYGTYLLNNFDDIKDFAYQFEEASAWTNANIERLDESDLDGAIDFLQAEFFNKYSDDIKSKLLPRKILLVKTIKASTLGLSIPNKTGYHMATANINSIAIANLSSFQLSQMDENEKQEFVKQVSYIFLAGYVVSARNEYFVDSSFADFCSTLYNSLINSNRKPASTFDDSYFFEKGFFRPDGSDTYYGTMGEDLQKYIYNVIFMNEENIQTYKQYPILKSKLLLVIDGLKNLGVDITSINPMVTQLN